MAQARDRSGRWLRSAAAGFLLGVFTGIAAQGQVELVSRVHPSQISETGAGADSALPFEVPYTPPLPLSISADGRYLVFISKATNLVPGQKDTNASPESSFSGLDVFLTDLAAGTTTLVSHSMAAPETAGNGFASEAVVAANGRWVAFTSTATDLVPGQTGFPKDFDQDLLLYDRVSGTSVLVAQGPAGQTSFFSDLALSADGRFLAFQTEAPLLPGQASGPGSLNVFLYDRVERTTRLVSHATSSPTTPVGGAEPRISADGRFIAFFAGLPGGGVHVYDRISQTFTRVGEANTFALSADGRYVVATTFNTTYLWERQTATTTVLSEEAGHRGADNSETPVALSADGRYVAFAAEDDQLVPGQQGGTERGLFLYDRISRTFTLASRRQGSPTLPAGGSAPALSADGRYLVFTSTAEALGIGSSGSDALEDVFLFDRISGEVKILSGPRGSSTAPSEDPAYKPVVSANGARVAFWSQAGDLVPGLADHNQGEDVFVYETASGERSVAAVRDPGLPSLSPGGPSKAISLSADGRWVAFESEAAFLVSGQVDTNGATDVFLYDRTTKTVVLVSRKLGSTATAGEGRSVHPKVSGNGRYVVYASRALDLVAEPPQILSFGEYNLFLFDRISGTTRLVGRTEETSGPEIISQFPVYQISSDGRWVTFTSQADDLVPGQQDQERPENLDVFLWDRISGSTLLVSRSAAGPTVTGNRESYLPALSADGRFVAFRSEATDLVPGQVDERQRDVFLFDRVTGQTSLVSHTAGSAITAAGASESSGTGWPVAPSISADGRFVVFGSSSTGLVSGADTSQGYHLYLYDRTLGTNELISVGQNGQISADGAFVSFISTDGRVSDDPDYAQLYLWNRTARTFTLATRQPQSGQASAGFIFTHSISADGRFIAFWNRGSDLGQIPGAQPNDRNVYLFDRLSLTNTLVSRSPLPNTSSPGLYEFPIVSSDGRHVAFTSHVPLVADDLNRWSDAYLFTLAGPVSVPACTLFDSRRRQDRPILRSGVRRVVKAHGACSVPARAKSVVVKVTAVNPTGKGNVRLYPGDSTTASAGILRFERGKTRSGVFTIPLAANGAGTFAILPQVAGNGTVHVVVEVSGYVE